VFAKQNSGGKFFGDVVLSPSLRFVAYHRKIYRKKLFLSPAKNDTSAV